MLWADMYHEDPEPYKLELEAIDSCQENDIVVCAAADSMRSGIWGELLSNAARNRGCVGAIVNGAVRDRKMMTEMGFQVFARGTCPYDSRNRQRVIDIQVTVELDQIKIHPGNWMAADEDGIVVIPNEAAHQVIDAALEKSQAENKVRDAIRAGMSATMAFDKFGVL
jgi:4-hydroxy-4-methyl-2-oxoglutarate aldolase